MATAAAAVRVLGPVLPRILHMCADGVRFFDAPDFPEEPPESARDRYRTGLDPPVAGNDGQARISYEDYVAALVDEIERLAPSQPALHRRHLN